MQKKPETEVNLVFATLRDCSYLKQQSAIPLIDSWLLSVFFLFPEYL